MKNRTRKVLWGNSILQRKAVIYPVSLGVAIILLWHYGVEFVGISSFTLPKPQSIVAELIDNNQFYLHSAITSLTFIFSGYVIGVAVGLVFALVVYYSDLLRRALYPILVVLFILPKILIAPILVLWLSAGPVYFTLVPITMVFFPVLENTLSGLNGIPERFKNQASMLQGSNFFTYRHLYIPFALPSIFAGLKIGMRQAVIGVIVAEFVAPEQGLGRILILGSQLGQPTSTWSGIVIIAIMGISLYKTVEILEHRLIFWTGSGTL